MVNKKKIMLSYFENSVLIRTYCLIATSMMSNSPSIKEQWSIHMVIVNILSKIKQLEAEFNLKPLSQRNDQSIEKLTKWATKHGAVLSGVEIHQFENNDYGMKASKSIAVGDKLVTVPRSLMMTEENMSTSPLCKVLVNKRTRTIIHSS